MAEPEPPNKTPPDPEDLTVWRFFGLGVQLGVTVALFAALGWWLDGRFGLSPWGLLVCGTAGVAAGMYHFLKAALK